MNFDVNNDIISIKQKLDISINQNYFDYIKQIINKNVEDCNLLYTQVCYLIKLFLLYDYETNKGLYNDYEFDEMFIRKCFGLVKNGKINKRNTNDDANNNNNNNNNNNDSNDKLLINRLIKFYDQYNSNKNNNIKFVKPNDVSSITHITDALARDLHTNITNNIKINFYKYLKQYINVNLKLEFKNIDNNQIYKIYNDIINNTLCSNDKFHPWITKHKKLLIPSFDKTIYIQDFKDGITNHKVIFTKFIDSYVNNDQNLSNLIFIKDKDNYKNKKKIIKQIINKMINDDNDNAENDKFNNYDEWINENKKLIVDSFNLNKKIDLDKELENNPYQFIKYMLFINCNLELNQSNKKYQIIPLRTNLTPKFIPIGIDAFVDILDSKYLLNKQKNYYHNDNDKGLILFKTYFNFDSKYILKIIKKGYIFSGLIYTDGYEINYIFNSKSYENKKNNFHSKGKEIKKYIKENTSNLNNEDKDKFIKELNEKNELEKKDKVKSFNEKKKLLKKNEKNEHDKVLKLLSNQINELDKNYENELNKIEKKHYDDLKSEFDKIDKTNEDNKKLMKEINERLNDILITNKVYLTHEYERNKSSLINDFNNTIDLKYQQLIDGLTSNEKLIKELKQKINVSKKKLKKLNKSKFNEINNQYKKETKKINKNINNYKKNKIIIKRLIDKIKEKIELLNYETTNDKSLTIDHIKKIKENIINTLLKIKNMKIFIKFNEYLNSLGDINEYFFNPSTNIKKKLYNCFKYLSTNLMKKKKSIKIINLLNSKLNKCKNKEKKKDDNWYEKSNKIKKELTDNSNELNKLLKEQKIIDNKILSLFKDKNNEIIKVDNMSKKLLEVLNKMNWVVIDPGVNSLFTMLSKDGKKKLSYSKSEYLNRTKRKKMQKQIEKIKKNKITEIENKLTKDNLRLKKSNNYENFNKYFKLKMEIHNELTKLYQDEKLIKLKWHSFINEKRAESNLVNKIKKKFGNDVVLILGDWSMNKSNIKTISTPNKKYEKILNKNFKVFKLNEFRTSIIENKTELKCENLKKEQNYKKMSIKEVYSLEKLKEKNKLKYEKEKEKKVHKILTCKTSSKLIKYINRDRNAVKNMVKIVSNYILKNKKPIIYVMGTKICNNIVTNIV